MSVFNNGYSGISVKLISFNGESMAKDCYEFSQYGLDRTQVFFEEYNKESKNVKTFVDELLDGTTFPKMALTGQRFSFSIEGISRICLAQLTRDSAIFCSESHGLRPLSQEFNIPMNIYRDESIMAKLSKAQEILEEAYIEACEKEIPFPESRYLCLHSQTISLTASFTASDFTRSCKSRTNNSFCDELNYVYRKMFVCLKNAINEIKDKNSKRIWEWLINERKCIDDDYYKRTNVFNGDFSLLSEDEKIKPAKPAQNDWRKSCWKMELERIMTEEPYLLTEKERATIKSWMVNDVDLPTTYDDNDVRAAKNAIKNMDYYR